MKKKAVPGSPSCFFCLVSSQHDNSGFFISLPLYHQNVNLWKMSIVYPFVQVPLAQITWYHHISMFPKVKNNILRAFYITESALQGWSRDIMLMQIEDGYHKKVKSHFSQTSATVWRTLIILLQKNKEIWTTKEDKV